MRRLTPEEAAYLVAFQPTRAIALGLLPYPDTCSQCGSPDGGCVCC